jgi:uncharacterized protein (TIGR04255 family)
MTEDIKFRTLINNNVTQFILRLDFHLPAILKFEEIIEKLSDTFDRTERRSSTNFIVNNIQGEFSITKSSAEDYVMLIESSQLSVTFSPSQAAIWLETNHYKNSSTYKDVILKITNIMKAINPTLKSRRIGLRYINEFKCPKITQIKNYINTVLTKNIQSMCSRKYISRVIAQEEYNFDKSKLRLQYGIPNKFHPATLKNFDIILDIDSFDDSQQSLDNFESIISDLNHKAYEVFYESVNKKYLEEITS